MLMGLHRERNRIRRIDLCTLSKIRQSGGRHELVRFQLNALVRIDSIDSSAG
jgi:hypothetical protein